MPQTSSAIGRYSDGLDGMRCLGMLAMLLFHGQLGMPGAFLALSQFFTLSGFLITSILIRQLDRDDTILLTDFWGRRYRRLLPASLLTLVGVLIFGATIATQQQLETLRQGVIAAALQVANWFFVVSDVSYVEQFQAPSPVQHFWSLAIEEQFYLILPVVMLAVYKVSRSIHAIAAALLFLWVASTVSMIWRFEAGESIDRLYYGTDTRAAEMLTGALVAYGLHRWPLSLGRAGSRVLGGAGLAAYSVVVYLAFTLSLNNSISYRGGLQVIALLNAIALIAVVQRAGPLPRILSAGPLPALGRLTYGIYLFHWPIMLTLTESRVGIGGWPLFAIQVSITVLLAEISSTYFEKPLRYARAEPGDRRFPIAMVSSVALIVAGAVALTQRDVSTDLAGLGEATAAAPDIVATGPPRVLVIGDQLSGDNVDELSADATRTEIVDTVAFECGVVSLEEACDWSSWAAAVDASDPDIVLFHVTEWNPDQITDSTGSIAADRQRWMADELSKGMDIATADGATLAWATANVDFAQILAQQSDPFHLAMASVIRADIGYHELGAVYETESLVDDLFLYRRRDVADGPRILVVGDSVSLNVGYGLERWAADTGAATIWSAGTQGCGLVDTGFVLDGSGREVRPDADCLTLATGWDQQISTFDPDVVVVVVQGPDYENRRLDDWSDFQRPGDPQFDSWLVEQYTALYDRFSANGATVLWFDAPCAEDRLGLLGENNPMSADRIEHVNNAVLPELADARPSIERFDFFSLLCPDGELADVLGGISDPRPDGVHLSAEASVWLGQEIGPTLVDLADQPR